MNDSFELSTEDDFDVIGTSADNDVAARVALSPMSSALETSFEARSEDDEEMRAVFAQAGLTSQDSLQLDFQNLPPPGASTKQPLTKDSAASEVNFGTMEVAPIPANKMDSVVEEGEEVQDEAPPPPPPPPRTTAETAALATFAASVTDGASADARLIDELQRDNERLAASLALAHERSQSAADEWEEERKELRRALAEIKTEHRLAERGDSEKVAEYLRRELALETKIRELEQELRQLSREKAMIEKATATDANAIERLLAEKEELRNRLHSQASDHEARMESLRSEFEKLRVAHDERLRAMRQDKLELTRLSFAKKMDMLRSENTKLNEEVATRNEENVELQHQVDGLRRQLHQLRHVPPPPPPVRDEDTLARAVAAEAAIRGAEVSLQQTTAKLYASEAALEQSKKQYDELFVRLERQERLATLAAAEASAARERLRATKPDTPADVAIAALSAQVAELERRLEQRQHDLARAVSEARTAARLELARQHARHKDDLAAKDAQLQRFRFELDRLLEALRRQLTSRAASAYNKSSSHDDIDFLHDLFLDDDFGSRSAPNASFGGRRRLSAKGYSAPSSTKSRILESTQRHDITNAPSLSAAPLAARSLESEVPLSTGQSVM